MFAEDIAVKSLAMKGNYAKSKLVCVSDEFSKRTEKSNDDTLWHISALDKLTDVDIRNMHHKTRRTLCIMSI